MVIRKPIFYFLLCATFFYMKSCVGMEFATLKALNELPREGVLKHWCKEFAPDVFIADRTHSVLLGGYQFECWGDFMKKVHAIRKNLQDERMGHHKNLTVESLSESMTNFAAMLLACNFCEYQDEKSKLEEIFKDVFENKDLKKKEKLRRERHLPEIGGIVCLTMIKFVIWCCENCEGILLGKENAIKEDTAFLQPDSALPSPVNPGLSNNVMFPDVFGCVGDLPMFFPEEVDYGRIEEEEEEEEGCVYFLPENVLKGIT